MLTATLARVDISGQRFIYNLSEPYSRMYFGPGTISTSLYFEVFSRRDFTKVWSAQHRELIKTLGVESHEYVLGYLGYIRAVDLEVVQAFSDEELLMCLAEFEKTSDDINVFLYELEKR